MVEFRPAGLGVLFWVGFGAFVPFSTICLFFPSFNDDLGTMPTRRPYSWKKNMQPGWPSHSRTDGEGILFRIDTSPFVLSWQFGEPLQGSAIQEGPTPNVSQ